MHHSPVLFFFLSSSVCTANLSCLPASTFSSLRFLLNSLSSPCFYVLRVAKCCFSWFSIYSFSYSFLIISHSFLCSSVSEALFALSFSFFLSERFFLAHAKAALLDFEHARVWSMLFRLYYSAYAVNLTYGRHTNG